MSEQISQSIIGATGALVGAILVWMRERRRDVSADRVASSADNRMWAEMFRTELDKERAERRRVETELAAVSTRAAAREAELMARIVGLTARVAELERLVTGTGSHATGGAA